MILLIFKLPKTCTAIGKNTFEMGCMNGHAEMGPFFDKLISLAESGTTANRKNEPYSCINHKVESPFCPLRSGMGSGLNWCLGIHHS